MKKNLWLIAVAASMLPFVLNGCYTQVASVGEDDSRQDYSQSSGDDTTGGQVNNYYGSDSYRDWRYQSAFRYYPHRPYWLWSVGWNDPYWYDNYDPWFNSGWDYWGYSPYRHSPWSYYPGWPPYTYYSDYGYGNPYYHGRSVHGIPVYSYGGHSTPQRPRSDRPTRPEGSLRPTTGTTPVAPNPSVGTEITRSGPSVGTSAEVRTEAKPRTRPSQETPWWQRTDRPRGNSGNAEAQAVPEGRRKSIGGTTSTQPQVKRDRPRTTGTPSVSTDAAPQRLPRNTGSTAPSQTPSSRQTPRERPQSREAVSAPSREAPRSAPSTPQRESAPKTRKAE